MHALAFLLYAPMQSWGDIAVGEIRNTYRYPSKSGIIGLISAAMGLDRYEDGDRIAELNSALRVAIRVDGDDSVLVDYHTTQVPARRKGAQYRMRADELRAPELETILSTREYLCDAVYSIFCFGEASLLREIKSKLEQPARVLYLGRKSCPLAIPCSPRLVEGDSLVDIQKQFSMEGPIRAKGWVPAFAAGTPTRIMWEPEINSGLQAAKIVRRNDSVVSRKEWQFGMRSECIGYLDMP